MKESIFLKKNKKKNWPSKLAFLKNVGLENTALHLCLSPEQLLSQEKKRFCTHITDITEKSNDIVFVLRVQELSPAHLLDSLCTPCVFCKDVDLSALGVQTPDL